MTLTYLRRSKQKVQILKSMQRALIPKVNLWSYQIIHLVKR